MLGRTASAVSAAVFWLILGGSMADARAAYDAEERAELAQHMKSAKATLEHGLKASEREGKPITAKFEVEHGKFQLSVYTTKGDGFTEVVADPQTGAIEKAEEITDCEDLEKARKQRDGLSKATTSLLAATERAVKANTGFRAVRVVPELKDSHPVAEVTLVRGEEFKTVSVKLD
jgi:hypothetical protein